MRRGKLDLVKHITSTRISSLTNKPLSYRTNSQPILKLLKIFIAMILFALCLNLVSAVDVGTCQVLSSSDVTYDLTASLDSDTGVCLNITGNNVTVDGHGYSIAYAKTGVGNAIHVEGQNSITLQHIRINQTSTARLTSPAVVFIDSEDNNIDNLTLSIAGEDSPDAYNHGINFQNVTNSTITKSDIDIETVCDYCYGIYLQSSSNDNTIEHTDIYTGGDWYARGIFLDTSHRNLIYNATILTVDYRGVGVYLSNADNNTVNRSWIRTTDTDTDASAVYFSNSDNNLIDNCNLSSTGSTKRIVNFRDTCYDNNVTNSNISYGNPFYFNGNIYRGFIDNVYAYSDSTHIIYMSSGTAPNVTVRNSYFNYSRSTSSCQPALYLNNMANGWQIHNVNITATGTGGCGLGLFGADNLNASNLIINTTGGDFDSAGIQLQDTQTNNYIYDSVINTADDISIYAYGVSGATGDLNLVNVSFQGVAWRAEWIYHTINVYWYLDVHVNDSSGSNVNNANVTGVDADDSQEFTVSTNSSGDIVRQIVLEYTQNSPTNRDYKTPYIINVNATGYHNKSENVTIDDNKEITITLNNRSLPDVELLSPVDSRIYLSTNVLVNITNSSNVDAVWYEWNNTNYTYTGAGTHDFKIEGNHSITAYANNSNGTSSHTVYFNISSSPINISSCQYLDSPDITYQLNQSFSSTHGYCLIIRADNVTIEGNNFEIEYASQESGTAIFSENHDYITIQNLNLNTTDDWRAASPAIQIKNSQYHNLENNSFYIDGSQDPEARNHAIYFLTVSNSNITNNSISIQAVCDDCYGVFLNINCDNNTIKDTYIYTNGNYDAYAIYLNQSDNNLMHNNEIRTDGGDGYGHYLYTSDNNIINKTFFRSTDTNGYAILLEEGSSNNLMNNLNISTTFGAIESIRIRNNNNYNNITNVNITTRGEGIYMQDVSAPAQYGTYIDNVFINSTNQMEGIYSYRTTNVTLTNSRIYLYENLQWDGAIELAGGSDYWNISNVNLTAAGNFAVGLVIDASNNLNATNLKINTSGTGNAEALRVVGTASNNNFFHSVFNAENDDEIFFYSSGSGTFNFYNTTLATASWDTNPTHTINIYWYGNPRVINITQSSISGANVTCHEADGTQVFTELTNNTGWITTKILREYTQDDNGARVDKTPHICNTSATNYFNDSSTYSIDQNKDFNITLTGTNVPRVIILSPEQSRIYPGTNLWVNFSYTNNTNNLWYRWNNTNYTYTEPVQHDFKEEGEHTLYAYANNTNGTSNDTVTFTIDLDPINVSDCQDLDSPDMTYQLNQSVTGTSGNCFTFKANNITFNGMGYWVRYASSGAGRAFYADGYNDITLKNTNINQTLTTIVGSPGITFKNSQGHNITNCTLSIAGDDSPYAYNYGVEFENVNDSYITKNTIDTLTTCNFCHGIYMHTGSDNNEISDTTISTSGNHRAYGVYLNSSDSNLIHNSSIRTYDYDGEGIYVYNSDNTIINSTFIRTASADNDADGIRIEAGSQGTWINRCNISTPRGGTRAIYLYGVSCDCYDTNITNTNITSTQGYGIYSSSGTLPNHRMYMDNLYIDTTDSVYPSIYISHADNCTLKNSELLHNDNSVASGALELRIGADNFKATNVNISTTGNYAVGIYFYSSTTANFNGSNIRINTTGTGDAEAVRYYGNQNNHWFYDSSLQADNDDEIYMYISGSGDLNLVNTTSTTSVWGGSTTHDLNVFWYLDVYVNDTDGNDLSSANVTAWDSTSSQKFTRLTDGTGWSRLNLLHAYQKDNAGTTYYNNYTVNATRGGYYENTTNVNLTTNMNAYIILAPLGGSINISLEVSPNPANWNYNVTISGHLNDSNDDPIPDHELNIFINGSQYYYNSSSGVLENKSGLPKPTTDVDGDYSYFFNTPPANQNYTIIVNTTHGGVSDEATAILNVSQKHINLTLTAIPNPVKTLRNITVYGYVNNSYGEDVANARIRIFVDNEEVNLTDETNQSDWWDYSFNYRIPITLNSGYAPRPNTTLVKKLINFSEYGFSTIDPNSIRIVDENGTEMPSRVLNWVEEDETAMIQWILQAKGILSKETDYSYFIYFDDAGSGHTDPYHQMQNDFFLCSGGDIQNNFTYAWSLNNRSLPTSWTQYDPPGTTVTWEKNRAVIADFDNDGKYDFAWTTDSSANIYIHLANGSLNEWSYELSENIYLDLYNWHGICSADFNEDGWMDIVVNADNGNIYYYENDGDGTFATASNVADIGGEPRDIVCEDFDNDGNIDIIAGAYSNGALEFLRGDGTGSFIDYGVIDASTTYGDEWHGIWAIDNDRDGDLDLIGKSNTSGTIYFENNGDATFQTGVSIADGYWVDQDVWSAGNTVDVDNDEELDLVSGHYANTDHRLSVYFGPVNISQQGTMMNYTFSTTGNAGFRDCKAPQPARDINISPASSADSLIMTDSSGDYNYTFEAPSSSGGITVKVNISYDFMTAEKSDSVTVEQDYINVSVNLNPSTTSPSNNVTLSGHINLSDGINVTNNLIKIYINDSIYYVSQTTGLLENITTLWWNTSWEHRTKIDEESFVSSNLNETIVIINLSTSNLISASKMNSDCGDTRFVDSNGLEMNYTLETSTCNTATTIYWVWMNLTGNDNTTIYAYYGNTDASLPTDYTNPDDDLLHYYHFDNSSEYGESNTKIYDFSKNGNNGSMGNGDEFINSSGKFGGALDLDGSGDYVSVTVSSSDLPDNEVTMLAWVYPELLTGDNYRTIVSTSGSTLGGYGLRVWGNSNTGKIQFWYRSAGSYHETMSNDAMALDKWTFVAATYNGTLLTYYINGSQSGSISNSDGIIPLSDIDIGSLDFSGNVDFWNGFIDEVRIYNRTLTADEILAMYNSTKDNFIENLSATRTDSNGDYEYNFTAPSTEATYEIKVNTSFNTMVGENTATLTVQETPSDTCTAPASGDWNVNCSDNCTWDTDTIVPGNMTITDSGHLTLSANLTFNTTGQYIIIDNDGCTFEIANGGEIKNKG